MNSCDAPAGPAPGIVVFATITKDAPKEQLVLGAKMFGAFAAAAFVLGWVLRLFPL